MKSIRHVIAFEYMSVVKTKSFIITLVLMMAAAVAISFLPAIIGFFGDIFGNGQETVPTHGSTADAYVTNDTANQIAIIDSTGHFTDELLGQYIPGSSFVRYTSHDINHVTQSVEDGLYRGGLYFVSDLSYMVIFQNNLAGLSGFGGVSQMVINEYRNRFLEQQNLHQDTLDIIEQIQNIDVQSILVPVGGPGFIVGYIANFLVFFPLVFSGSIIGMAIINEKTSKTVEIIFTSIKPTVIIIGKVIAAALVIFTQTAAIIGAGILGMQLTDNNLMQFISPQILAELANPITYLYVGVFFVLAFVSFSFIFAAFAATVRDVQETGSVNAVPNLILVGAFYIGLAVSMDPSWLTPGLLNILSFFPLVSPFVMIIRVTAFVMPTYQILWAITANVAYTAITAVISIKIYKKSIMAYGQRKNFFSKLKAFSKA